MPTFLLTHHFPANFQGSPETAVAAAAWFASLGRTTPGPGNAEIPEPHRLGNYATATGRRLAYTVISADDLEAAMGLPRPGRFWRAAAESSFGGSDLNAECASFGLNGRQPALVRAF